MTAKAVNSGTALNAANAASTTGHGSTGSTGSTGSSGSGGSGESEDGTGEGADPYIVQRGWVASWRDEEPTSPEE